MTITLIFLSAFVLLLVAIGFLCGFRPALKIQRRPDFLDRPLAARLLACSNAIERAA